MTFPVYLGFGLFKLHPHFVFEVVAYGVAMGLLRRTVKRDAIPLSQRSSVVVGGLIGALVGAKILVLLQHIDWQGTDWRSWLRLGLQGKTVVGALLGGLIGVELTKKWRRSTPRGPMARCCSRFAEPLSLPTVDPGKPFRES